MKPQHFAALAAAAISSVALALMAYTAAAPWQGAPSQGKLFPSFSGDMQRVKRMEISQGPLTLELERSGEVWQLKGRDGYPANSEKVRSLLSGLATAELVEPKTRKKERYTELEVEDPSLNTANSHLLKLVDEAGAVIAEVIIGKKSQDAFGAARSGTFVRRPNDEQTWLVNAALEAPGDITDWVKPRIFESQANTIKKIRIEVPGSDPLDIGWDLAAKRHKFGDAPKGKRVRYANEADEIAEAVSKIDLADVRKAIPLAADEPVSTATLEIDGGLKVVLKLRKTKEGDWLSLTATGEGESKSFAETLTAAVKDWEFKIPTSKAGEIFKKPGDVYQEDTQDTEMGPGANPKP